MATPATPRRSRRTGVLSRQAIVAETHTHPGLCTKSDYYLLQQSGIQAHPVEFQVKQQHVRPTSEIQSRRRIIGRPYVHKSVFFFSGIGIMSEEQSGSKDLKRQRETASPSSPEDEIDTNGSAHLDHDALPGRTKICNGRDERAAKAGSGLPAARRWPTMSNQIGRRGR
jgi:hypothetical protein